MGRIKGKRWSKEQKFSMVLSLVKGEATAEALSKRYGVGISSLYKWRDAFLQGGQQALGSSKDTKGQVQELAIENQHLKEALADAVVKLEMQKKWFKR